MEQPLPFVAKSRLDIETAFRDRYGKNNRLWPNPQQ